MPPNDLIIFLIILCAVLEYECTSSNNPAKTNTLPDRNFLSTAPFSVGVGIVKVDTGDADAIAATVPVLLDAF